jgi:hypothetical protein
VRITPTLIDEFSDRLPQGSPTARHESIIHASQNGTLLKTAQLGEQSRRQLTPARPHDFNPNNGVLRQYPIN